MRIFNRATVSAVALTSALLLTACGGGNASSPEGSASTPAGNDSGTGPAAVECPPAEGTPERVTAFEQAPPMCIDPAKMYTAKVETDAGEFTVALDAEKAPKTVNNFVFLARHQYYDGTPFHRVIKGFMAQGGDPEGTGRGGPGYTIEDELPSDPYEVGSIAMANTGQPNSGGSQFFIVTGPDGVGLPPAYALFGKVTDGMDVVQKIEADGTEGEGMPPTVHQIEKVTITEE